MADLNMNPVDRIRFEYGLAGNRDHTLEFRVTSVAGGPTYPLIPYIGPTPEVGFEGDLTGSNPATIVDYCQMIYFALNLMWDNDIRLHACRIEELNNDLLVTAVKTCNLTVYDPVLANTRAGMSGQYALIWGYNQAGRPSKRMVAGQSSRLNPEPSIFIADAGGDTAQAGWNDLLNRIQGVQVAGKPVQHWGETSQLDVDNETARIIGGFGNTIYHGQHDLWKKRYAY